MRRLECENEVRRLKAEVRRLRAEVRAKCGGWSVRTRCEG